MQLYLMPCQTRTCHSRSEAVDVGSEVLDLVSQVFVMYPGAALAHALSAGVYGGLFLLVTLLLVQSITMPEERAAHITVLVLFHAWTAPLLSALLYVTMAGLLWYHVSVGTWDPVTQSQQLPIVSPTAVCAQRALITRFGAVGHGALRWLLRAFHPLALAHVATRGSGGCLGV